LPGELIAERKGHKDDVYIANFSPDENHIITTSADNIIRIWRFSRNIKSGNMETQLVASIQNKGFVSSASFSPDGKRILITTVKDRRKTS
jgi:WD40 repeat protein